MPDNGSNKESESTDKAPAGGGRSKDEIALELMKFVAVTTGYGKGGQTGAGFSGKPGTKSPEEQADALLELYERCRTALKKDKD
jgi:hypothetical protein